MVYFHGATGKFLPSMFLAMIKFLSAIEAEHKLFASPSIRRRFEDFLLNHRDFVNQVSHSNGSRTRPVDSLVTMYGVLFDRLSGGLAEDSQIVAAMQTNPQLKDIRDIPDSEREHSQKFTQDVRRLAFILCSALRHSSSLHRYTDAFVTGPGYFTRRSTITIRLVRR